MRNIAEERIERLEALARDAVKAGEPDRAREYVRLANRLAERHRCGVPRSFERFTCDRCDAFLVPGRNARVRLQEGSHVVIRCLDCGATARYPYVGDGAGDDDADEADERDHGAGDGR